jgi:hypothetical protein
MVFGSYSIYAVIALTLFLVISALRNKLLRSELNNVKHDLKLKDELVQAFQKSRIEANKVRDESVQIINKPSAIERDAFEEKLYE